MELVKAVFLGILQGLTEFLPVSSSGHLAIAQELLPGATDASLAFEVMLHVGTLVSVLAYFARDLASMSTSVLGGGGQAGASDRRTVALLAVATLPIVGVGLTAASVVERAFHSVAFVGAALMFTGVALYAASRLGVGRRTIGEIHWGHALAIGAFQAVAVLPGVSRSGLTIVGALVCGLEREAAARFAFLLAIPAIAGALVHSAREVATLAGAEPLPLAAGVAAAALTGFAAVGVMMRAVRRGRLAPFALYCLAAGFLALVLGGLR